MMLLYENRYITPTIAVTSITIIISFLRVCESVLNLLAPVRCAVTIQIPWEIP